MKARDIADASRTTFLHVASFASILGLYLSAMSQGEQSTQWYRLPVLAFAVIFLGVAVWDLWLIWQRRPRRFTEDAKIALYMAEWIQQQGRAVVFSRDLSWTSNVRAKEALKVKAKSGDLKLFVEEMVPVAEELRTLGAQVITYKNLGHIPRSRFTIVGHERAGSRVAIGARLGGAHVVEEFEEGAHPLFSLALDMVKFVEAGGSGQP